MLSRAVNLLESARKSAISAVYNGIELITGTIIDSSPNKRLYKVRISDTPYSDGYAIPLGGSTTFPNLAGSTDSTLYTSGDVVLCIKGVSSDGYLYILGSISTPTDKTKRPKDARIARYPDKPLTMLSTLLQGIATEVLQDTGLMGDKYDGSGQSFADISSGDRIITGAETLLNVSDYAIDIRAGEAKQLLVAPTGSLIQLANFLSTSTLSEYTRNQYIQGKLLYTRELSGDAGRSAKKGTRSLFNFKEQFSDILHGYRKEILDPTGRPIAQDEIGLDGSISLRAANRLTIKKTSNITSYVRIDDSPITTAKVPKEVPQTNPLALADSDSNWGKRYLSSTQTPQILAAPSKNDWGDPKVADNQSGNGSSFMDATTNQDIPLGIKEAVLDFPPDGSIVLRDAWGSEIRLSGGNIQISAANNIINISGRDTLNIASGMISSSASVGIDMGAGTGDISIAASKDIRIACDKLSSTATEHTQNSGISRISADQKYEDINKSSITAVRGSYVLSVASADINASRGAVITTKSSIIALADSGLQLGCQVVDLHGNLTVNKHSLTVTGVMDSEYNSVDVSSPGTAAQLTVHGAVLAGGVVASDSGVQTNGGLYGNIIATTEGEPYKLRTRPKKMLEGKISNNQAATIRRGMSVDILGQIKGLFSDEVLKALKHVYRYASAAFRIIKPSYSGLTTRKTITPASCAANDGMVSYIYPGEGFWTKDGLVTYDSNNVLDPHTVLSVSGCAGMQLNEDNVNKKG